jgi:NADH-ubiquinone oxidoreductase chain 2
MTANGRRAIKFILFMTLLSLGGLPPFIGFLPKWIVIQTLIMNNLRFITTLIVAISLVTLYYYLRICYSRFLILHEEVKWGTNLYKENKIIIHRVILSSISIIGLIVCTALTNIN